MTSLTRAHVSSTSFDTAEMSIARQHLLDFIDCYVMFVEQLVDDIREPEYVCDQQEITFP